MELPNIPGYVLEGTIGQGGQGCVFRAFRESDGRKVAIKVIHGALFSSNEEACKRFLREIDVSKNFAHANVIQVLDGGRLENGYPFLVMEYLEGQSLSSRISTSLLSEDELYKLLWELAEALDYIHSQELLHRDIKPANVWLTEDRVVLLDFGLCFSDNTTRLTKTGHVVGSISTMSPEQIHGKPIGQYSDIYSLGATAYYGATGRAPYSAGQLILIGTEELFDRLVPPHELNSSISPRMSALIMKCIHHKAEERYSGAKRLQNALYKLDCRDTSQITLKLEIVKKRHRYLFHVLFLVLVLGAFFVWFGRARSPSNKAARGIDKKIDLKTRFKCLVGQETWSNEELISFGREIIKLERTKYFGIEMNDNDPFVVGAYVIGAHLQGVKKVRVLQRGSLVRNSTKGVSLFIKLFHRLGKKSFHVPNHRFLYELVRICHHCHRDAVTIEGLKGILDDTKDEDLRVICEYYLACAIFLSDKHNYNPDLDRNEKPSPPTLEAQWLITPSMERWRGGRFESLSKWLTVNELISMYLFILEAIKTKESKDEVHRILGEIEGSQMERDLRANLIDLCARVLARPLRSQKTISKEEKQEVLDIFFKAINLAGPKLKYDIVTGLLQRAEVLGCYEQVFERVGRPKVSDFPQHCRYKIYRLWANQCRDRNDYEGALVHLKNAKLNAPDPEAIESVRKVIEQFGVEAKILEAKN